MTLIVKCPRETDHAVRSGRERWSFMCVLTVTVEMKSAGISEAWGSASFPASIPSEAVGCWWE